MAKTIVVKQTGSPIRRPKDQRDTLIGLGGSIKSFLNIYKCKQITSNLFIEKSKELTTLNQEEKIAQFKLQQDRADVIDYALKIYLMIINKL